MQTHIQDRITDELIASAYEAATGDGSWSAFTAACGTAFPWSKTAFCLFDRDADHCTAFSAVNFDPAFLESWEAYYSGINAWIAMSEGNDWDLRWSYESVPEHELKKTEFYADWVLPQDDICLGFAVNMHNDAARTFLMTNTFRKADEAAAEIQYAIMRRVRPHLLRAYELQKRLAAERTLTGHLRAALDRVEQAMAVVDAGRGIVFANRAAETMFAAATPMKSLPGGRLSMTDAADDARLAALVKRMACPREVADGPFFRLRHGGSGRFVALVAPLYAEHPDGGMISLNRPAPQHFIVMIADLGGRAPGMGEMLIRLYRLTPAEAGLAIGLFDGASLKEHAAARGTSYQTVRAQLKALQAKLGTTRQSDLMRMLARLAALAK